MPQIPQYTQRTTASSAGTVGAPYNPEAETAGLRAVSRVIGEIGERSAAADASLKIAKAQAEWQQHLLERQEQAQPGAPDFAKAFVRDFDAYATEVVASGKTRTARAFLKERMAVLGGAMATDAMAYEYKAREDHTAQQFEEGVKLTATNAELDPDRYKERLAEQLAVLDSLPMNAQRKADLKIAAADMVQARAGVGFARRDPDATMQRLLSPAPDDTLFRTMSPRGRDAVLNEVESVQRIRLQAEEVAYRKAERSERDAADAVAKEGDKLLATGNLTSRWIEQNRDRLDPQDHRYFYSQLTGNGKGGPRNVDAYLALRDRAGRGEDVRSDARAAVRSGQIGVDDYDRLTSEVESSRPGWYARGSSYISTAGKPNDLNPVEGSQQRLASMLDDWQVWADDHPKATDNEARDAYQRIVEEYGLINQKAMTLNMRAPRFMVGTRDAPDLETTAQRTVEALQKGEIDEAEAQRQALLIKQWRQALGNQKQATK